MDEAFDWVSENQGIAALTWVAVVFATAVLWLTTKGDSEAAVDFEVPLPKQLEDGWQGEVLQEPSLKVCSSLYFYFLLSFFEAMPFSRILFILSGEYFEIVEEKLQYDLDSFKSSWEFTFNVLETRYVDGFSYSTIIRRN
jgi:hypothetical protein